MSLTPPSLPTKWFLLSADAVAAQLKVDPARGLADAEVDSRLAQFGANSLVEKKQRSAWMLFLHQFRGLLVIVLLFAAILAGAVGDLVDSVVILVVVVLNALLGFYQEYRAEQTLAALKNMLAHQAEVRRGGRVVEVAAKSLVPGDVVLLEAGDRVPADGRIIEAHGAEIDEAALTGESQPVGKHCEPLPEGEVPLGERLNMAFMNTVVTRGRLVLLVTGTGMGTEMGRLTGLIEEAEESPTPLQIQLDQVGKRLALLAGLVVSLIFVLGLLRHEPLVQTVLTAIALAVAAIPEGLPAVVTVTLAVGMRRMGRKQAIVKRLAAVETLGCTTVICSDKTGTLTLNQMTARSVWFRGQRLAVAGRGEAHAGQIRANGQPLPELQPLLLPIALCNDSRIEHGRILGGPTEKALLALAAHGDVDHEAALRRMPRLAELPFDSAHKFMATFHHDGDRVQVFVKGAPDVLIGRCNRLLGADGIVALDDELRKRALAENEALAGQAMRVLAVASRTVPAGEFSPDGDLSEVASDLIFIGLVGLIDPPRPEAKAAIALCRQAGIEVKMITGDHRITAMAIGRELGLGGKVLSGAELDKLDQVELAACIDQVSVFARVAPEHKVRLVRALKARGHVVAMTGDGVNDAPALKNADIGVAMGDTGTEVTKEAATMILTDDNFATIVGAVKEGRTIYDNIVKFVRFQLSTNIGAILAVASAPLLGLPIPFTPIQILWINIIMDGPPAMTLGLEPARPGIMEEPPRSPTAQILTLRRLGQLLAYGLTMAVGSLGVLVYGLASGPEARAFTLAFTTFVLFQLFNAFNARAELGSAFNRNFFRNDKLWTALGGVLVLQVLVVHWGPAQRIFNTTSLSLGEWGLAFAVASTILLFDEARKLLQRLWMAFRDPARPEGR